MPAAAPPVDALAAMLGPSTRIVRRCDIYEEDGETPFQLNAGMLNGSVSVDAGRNERRSFDLVLDNTDGTFHNYPGGFWYDKVIKLYRGVEYDVLSPSYLNLTGDANSRASTVHKNEFNVPDLDIRWHGRATTWASGTAQTLASKYGSSGNRTWLFYLLNNGAIRLYISSDGTLTSTASTTATIPTFVGDNEDIHLRVTRVTSTGETNFYRSFDGQTWTKIGNTLTLAAGVTPFYTDQEIQVGSQTNTLGRFAGRVYSLEVRDGVDGNVLMNPNFDTQSNGVTSFVDDHLNSWIIVSPATIEGGYPDRETWEAQIGEFLIDNIDTQDFPHTTAVSGRDFTKKLLEDEFAQATAFVQGTPVEDVIKTIALNGGITKFILPFTARTLGREFLFEAGVNRWQAIHDIALAYDHEVFFDSQGYLVLRLFQDPVSSPLAFTFETGEFGTLASYRKRVSGTRIYNHIVVTGQATDQTPIVAEAENNEPSSPTSIQNLGRRRTYRYTSSFITTQEQAQAVADSLLKIKSLESFDLSLQSIVLPWIEVSEIIEFIDPNPNPGDPSRFLLHDISIPLGLEMMSATGKRVTVVG